MMKITQARLKTIIQEEITVLSTGPGTIPISEPEPEPEYDPIDTGDEEEEDEDTGDTGEWEKDIKSGFGDSLKSIITSLALGVGEIFELFHSIKELENELNLFPLTSMNPEEGEGHIDIYELLAILVSLNKSDIKSAHGKNGVAGVVDLVRVRAKNMRNNPELMVPGSALGSIPDRASIKRTLTLLGLDEATNKVKLSRRQLRQIIKENRDQDLENKAELTAWKEANPSAQIEDFPNYKDWGKEYVDSLEKVEESMKITRRQLRQIIKEELISEEFKVKDGNSICPGGGINHDVQVTVNSTGELDKKLFKETKKFLESSPDTDREFLPITKDNVNAALARLICKNFLDKHLGRRSGTWDTLPPHVKGSQNKPSLIGFSIESGKARYDSSIAKAAGWNNDHTGFDWNTFNADKFVKALQSHVNHYPILRNPQYKFVVYVAHGFRPF